MADLKKVQPGDPLKIPAATFNTFIDAARDYLSRQRSTGGQAARDVTQPGIVLVKNTSGVDVPRFGVLGIGVAAYGGVVFTPSEGDDALAGFQSRIALKGVKPQPATHGGRFVVTQEPIANGAIGRACISGVTICQVTGSGQCADVDKDVTDSLKMGGTGCEVLWWDTGTSKRWAVVRLGTMTPRVQQFKVTGMGADWIVAKMWDGTTLDTTEVYIAKPYQLRRTPFDGKTYLGYTVSYTDHTTRTLTPTMVGGGSCPPETQIVIPGYTWNTADDQKDVIYAIGPVGSGVGVSDGNGAPLTWLDLNVDGRAWTEKFTE